VKFNSYKSVELHLKNTRANQGWKIVFSPLMIIVTKINFTKQQRRHYNFNLIPFYGPTLSLLLVSYCEIRLPPTPDDPLYANHEIWQKGVHEVTDEERARNAERKRIAEQEAKERMAMIQAEQE
jgi:hypothetical protein